VVSGTPVDYGNDFLASCDHPPLDVARAAFEQTQELPWRDTAERLAGPAADLDFHPFADRTRPEREADADPIEVSAATACGLDLRPEPAQVVFSVSGLIGWPFHV
jgi:hypothetical protein